MSPSPNARFGDELLGTRDYAAAEAAEPLVERDVYGVEQRCDLRVRTLVIRGRLPDPGTIEMRRGASSVCPVDLADEVVPLRKPATDLSLWQLDQQRADGRVERLQVLLLGQLSRAPTSSAFKP